jgi:hypothetical protein
MVSKMSIRSFPLTDNLRASLKQRLVFFRTGAAGKAEGCGIVLGPKTILTCYHVFHDPEGNGEPRGIEQIRFRFQDLWKNWELLQDGWKQPIGPASKSQWRDQDLWLLSRREPDTSFPRIQINGQAREGEALVVVSWDGENDDEILVQQAKVLGATDPEDTGSGYRPSTLNLNINGVKGMSGGGVFRLLEGGSFELVGILSFINEKNNNKLRATRLIQRFVLDEIDTLEGSLSAPSSLTISPPLVDASADQGSLAQKTSSIPEVSLEDLKKAKQWLAKVLKDNLSGAQALGRFLDPRCERKESEAEDAFLTRLLEKILELPIREFLKLSWKTICESPGTKDEDKVATGVRNIVRVVLPVRFECRGAETRLLQALRRGKPVGVAVSDEETWPAAFETVAEIIMAARDGRETFYIEILEEAQLPTGGLNLPTGPECAFSSGDVFSEQQVHQHITRKFSGPENQGLEMNKKIVLANDWLQAQSEDHGQTRYICYRLPSELEERTQCLSHIEKLKGKYSGIVFICLNDDFERKRTERTEYNLLAKVLQLLCSDPSKQEMSPHDQSL